MSVNFGSTSQRSGNWAWFKPLITSKTLKVQYEEDSGTYFIYGYDLPEVCTCTIWTGAVPESVVASGYSQAQNDTDKADFESNYKPNANLSIGTTVSGVERATYIAETALAGANNKDMVSIFNPSGSGKIVRVFEVWAAVPSSSGATVIIPFEMRLATAITTGTTVTPAKYDSADGTAQAVVRTAPTGITDHTTTPKMYTWVEQINTAQGSTDAHSHVIHDGSLVDRTKPIVLREGEGLYLRQIATNTSTFRMGLYWTEE